MGVKERFVGSIEYLRKLGFFEDYANLTSEEIFKKISEMKTFLKNLDEEGHLWMGKSIFEIDRCIALFDNKRVWGVESEYYVTRPQPGVGLHFLNKLAGISRGVFQPIIIREECKTEKNAEGRPNSGYCRVYFTFRGREEVVEFLWDWKNGWDFLPALQKLNQILKGTGYRYYRIYELGVYYFIVLRPWEVGKLKKERRWDLVTGWL
ncbi:MAG: hypothetical protein QW506_07805 [Thermoproteota archaeon]